MDECPVCGLPLDGLPQSGRERHVNDCLDYGGEAPALVLGAASAGDQPRERARGGDGQRSSSGPGAPADRREASQDDACVCPVCSVDISALSLVWRQAHVARCGTGAHPAPKAPSSALHRERPGAKPRGTDMKGENYFCRLCSKDLSRSTYEQRVNHVKKCSRTNKAPSIPGAGEGGASGSGTRDKKLQDGRKRPRVEAEEAGDDGIVPWLASLGLEKHAEAFLREEVTLDIVGTLMDSDLASLGVTSLGARRKILTSVCALPIPSTLLRDEFALLAHKANTKEHKAARNNRRITDFVSPRSPAKRQGEASGRGGGGKGAKRGKRRRGAPLANIGNSNLAVFGDKDSFKSLWNYAGE